MLQPTSIIVSSFQLVGLEFVYTFEVCCKEILYNVKRSFDEFDRILHLSCGVRYNVRYFSKYRPKIVSRVGSEDLVMDRRNDIQLYVGQLLAKKYIFDEPCFIYFFELDREHSIKLTIDEIGVVEVPAEKKKLKTVSKIDEMNKRKKLRKLQMKMDYADVDEPWRGWDDQHEYEEEYEEGYESNKRSNGKDTNAFQENEESSESLDEELTFARKNSLNALRKKHKKAKRKVSQLELLRDKLTELEMLQSEQTPSILQSNPALPHLLSNGSQLSNTQNAAPSLASPNQQILQISNALTVELSEPSAVVMANNAMPSNNFATASPSKQFLRRSNTNNNYRLDSLGRDKRGLGDSGGGPERDIHGFRIKEEKKKPNQAALLPCDVDEPSYVAPTLNDVMAGGGVSFADQDTGLAKDFSNASTRDRSLSKNKSMPNLNVRRSSAEKRKELQREARERSSERGEKDREREGKSRERSKSKERGRGGVKFNLSDPCSIDSYVVYPSNHQKYPLTAFSASTSPRTHESVSTETDDVSDDKTSPRHATTSIEKSSSNGDLTHAEKIGPIFRKLSSSQSIRPVVERPPSPPYNLNLNSNPSNNSNTNSSASGIERPGSPGLASSTPTLHSHRESSHFGTNDRPPSPKGTESSFVQRKPSRSLRSSKSLSHLQSNSKEINRKTGERGEDRVEVTAVDVPLPTSLKSLNLNTDSLPPLPDLPDLPDAPTGDKAHHAIRFPSLPRALKTKSEKSRPKSEMSPRVRPRDGSRLTDSVPSLTFPSGISSNNSSPTSSSTSTNPPTPSQSLHSSGNLEKDESSGSLYSSSGKDKGSLSPRSSRSLFNFNVGTRSMLSHSHESKEKEREKAEKGEKEKNEKESNKQQQPLSPRLTAPLTPRERERGRERGTPHSQTPREKSISPSKHASHRNSSPSPSSLIPSSPRPEKDRDKHADRSRAVGHTVLLPSLSKSREVSPRPLSSSAATGHHNIIKREKEEFLALLQSTSSTNANDLATTHAASVSYPSTTSTHHPGLFASLANQTSSSLSAKSSSNSPTNPPPQVAQGFAMNPNQTTPLSPREPRSKSFAFQSIRHDTTDS